ncbi:MAG: helix-turn-helix domain-containing protein [Parvularculaceae bacterium]
MGARKLPEDTKRVRPPAVDSPFFWAAEAAIYLRISLRALENFRETGEGPVYRKHGARIVYHLEDLQRWSSRRRYRSSSKREGDE